jgi:Uma2 family endonuclease
MAARIAFTYGDYAALPDDGKRYEIYEGELCEMAAPTTLHQIVLLNLGAMVLDHVRSRQLGRVLASPIDVLLSDAPGETTVLQPDLVFLDRERLALIRDRAIEGSPALAIEILSPSTASIDRGRKRALYARYGVPYYWLVDVDAHNIEACVLRSGAYVVAARVSGTEPVDLPPFVGLSLVPASLWQ